MLLLFAFSITPQIVLHNTFSHHQHQQFKSDGVHKIIYAAIQHCSLENVFTASVFTIPSITGNLVIIPGFIMQRYFFRDAYPLRNIDDAALRGPPAVA